MNSRIAVHGRHRTGRMAMGEAFDPYLKWLGIAPADQPPNHYRLLGIPELIDDADVIENAADRQMAHVRTFATGQHSQLSQQLLNEIAAAKVCLLHPEKKKNYDAELRAAAKSSAPPPPPARPVLKTRRLAQAHPLTPAADTAPHASPLDAIPSDRSHTARLKKRNTTVQQAAFVMALLLVAGGLAWVVYRATSDDTVTAERTDEGVIPVPPPPVVEPPKETPPPKIAIDPPPRREENPPDDPTPPSTDVDKPEDPPPIETGGPKDAPSLSNPVDLLKEIDPASNAVDGNWTFDKGVLVSPADREAARLMVPGSVPGEYQLDMEVTRTSGDNMLFLALVAGGKQVEVYFDWHRPGETPRTGFLPEKRFPAKVGSVLPIGEPRRIRCQVSASRIVVSVDDETILDQHDGIGEMIVSDNWPIPQQDVLCLGSHSSGFRFTKLQLTPLGSAVAPLAIEEKLPVPEGPELENAQATLADVFKDELAAARSDEERAALAKTLLGQGTAATGKPVEMFVMLRAARNLAAKAGDAETALAAIDRLAERFDVEPLAMKGEALIEVAKEVRLREDQPAVVMLAGQVVREMVAADRFDLAEPLTKLAQAAATRSRDVALRKEVAASVKQFDTLHEAFRKVEPSFQKLQQSPDDPEANLAVGRYRALVKRDWPAGLVNLAAGSDEALKNVAARDLAGALTPAEKAKLGDAWWDVAEAEKESDLQTAMKSRAGHWYGQALPGLTGLTKEKANQRLDEIRQLDPTGRMNPNDWIVKCWQDRRWVPYPLSKMTVDFKDGVLTVTNTTGIHTQAFLVYQPFVSRESFKATCEINGEIRYIGIISADGQDNNTFADGSSDNQWHIAVVERAENHEFHTTWDGQPASLRYNRLAIGDEAQFAISVTSGKTCSIRRFQIQTNPAR